MHTIKLIGSKIEHFAVSNPLAFWIIGTTILTVIAVSVSVIFDIPLTTSACT